MQEQGLLYIILGVALVVPVVIMWRTRVLRIEARIEIPADEPIVPPKVNSMPPPSSWEVSDAIAAGGTLRPVRAGSLRPARTPSQRPVTLINSAVQRASAIIADPTLPLPVRKPSLGSGPIRFAANDEATAQARASGLPVPLRISARPPQDDDNK